MYQLELKKLKPTDKRSEEKDITVSGEIVEWSTSFISSPVNEVTLFINGSQVTLCRNTQLNVGDKIYFESDSELVYMSLLVTKPANTP